MTSRTWRHDIEFRHRAQPMDAKWYRQLGGRIARFRTRARLTQEALAERAGIAPSYLARIESGSRRPTIDVLGKLSDALGLPLYRFIADERAVRAAEGQEAWGRSSRALSNVLVDLEDGDVDLLLRLANRLRE